MIYKIIATIEHKQEVIRKDYKSKLIDLNTAEKTHDRLQIELDKYNSIIDNLYYQFELTGHVRQALSYASEKGLDKWLVIKYFDARYKKLFKVNKFFTKQYLRIKSDVMWHEKVYLYLLYSYIIIYTILATSLHCEH